MVILCLPDLSRKHSGKLTEFLILPFSRKSHELHGSHDSAVLFLGFLGGRAQVWDGDDFVRLDDLFVREVSYVAAYDSIGNGFLQRRGVHKPSPGEVEKHDALLHHRELIGVDEALSILVLGNVQRDKVGLCQEPLQAGGLLDGAGQLPRPPRWTGTDRIP